MFKYKKDDARKRSSTYCSGVVLLILKRFKFSRGYSNSESSHSKLLSKMAVLKISAYLKEKMCGGDFNS